MMEDTIAALSTAPQASGIHVIRMSGGQSREILMQVFEPAADVTEMEHGRMYFGHVMDNGVFLDEVYAVSFYAPKSYTGEDVVEIQCHGASVLSDEILKLLFRNGAVPAQPGEFTKRAFLNGRIDLVQAEAVMDVINSSAKAASRNAFEQLEGRFSREIGDWKERLVDVLANIDADIDFPEADIEVVDRSALVKSLELVQSHMEQMLSTVETGKILKEGIRLVICGVPNAGKSSLMNTLLGQDRAIVTEIPGTTRDVLEEAVSINGVKLRVFDTAGVHDTQDYVENIGIERTRKALADADVALLLIDGAQGQLSQGDEELIRLTSGKKRIVAVNKSDVMDDDGEIVKQTEAEAGQAVLEISAKTGDGVELLRQKIYELAVGADLGEGAVITNARQAHCLRAGAEALKQAVEEMRSGVPLDIAGISVREAYSRVLELVGEEISDEVIDRIFESFCLGK